MRQLTGIHRRESLTLTHMPASKTPCPGQQRMEWHSDPCASLTPYNVPCSIQTPPNSISYLICFKLYLFTWF